MNICAWCGRTINGEAVSPYKCGALIMDDGDYEREVAPAFSGVFCCSGCAWSFHWESHRLYGSPGGEYLRVHLIEAHDLKHPPGKPAGAMGFECTRRFETISKNINDEFNL